MADEPKKKLPTPANIVIPGLGAVPVVAIKLPDGTIALRHPSELSKTVPAPKMPGGGE